MHKTTNFIAVLFLLFPIQLYAQSKKRFTISGTIKDKSSGETLPGASVSLRQLPGTGGSTNAYGFYSITAPEGKYTMVISYTGYASDTMVVELEKNVLVNINMGTANSLLREVTISGTARKSNNILTTPVGLQKLSIEDIKNVPVLLGEKDVLKTIQLLPGIQSAGDGKSGFFVRGGSSDQNLILLDEATVYNASHVLGFFSVFNSDAIKDISIYKGGMPSNYGGRLASVEDIQMKEGNNKIFHVNGGLGLIASRLSVEGPILKQKGSFMVSARRSYLDLFTKLASDTLIKNGKLYFYDFNLKANYQVNEHNRIFLSGYFGKDLLNVKHTGGIDYGNATATFRWNHIFSSKLFSNTSLIYSNFLYNVHVSGNTNDVKISSAITDYHLKQDFNYYINSANKIDAGVDINYHVTQPGSATASKSSSFNDVLLQKKYSLESAAYVSHEWTATERLKFVYGIRFSLLTVLGAGTFYTYDKEGNIISSNYYGSGKTVKSYLNPEPRFSASYQLNNISSVKVSYDRNVQNIHLLNNSTSFSPTSVYLPSSNNVKPEIADQIAVGYYRHLHQHMFELSTEVYYKFMYNQIDYKNGANLVGNENVEADLATGKGRGYGWETYFKKTSGVFTGWISYTLSRTERQIDGINNGNYYPAAQDQTHHLSVVGLYQLNKKWTFSADFVYNTGNAITWPSGKFNVDGTPVYYYGGRNNNRLPAYHRLDIGATWVTRKTDRTERSWTFSIYNVYGRANPYTISFQKDPAHPDKTQVEQTTLFKMVPAVTYNFKF
jgi:hypothetical protein